MLIDIGTNGEMAIRHNGRLYCCSTAAGPAFEGAGLSMGMPGEVGAIDHVTLDGDRLAAHVIGDASPRGICGSGIVDALACLMQTEQLDESGLIEDDPTDIAPPVSLTQKDIRMVQLAKSAIHAGLCTLVDNVSLDWDDIAGLSIAGGSAAISISRARRRSGCSFPSCSTGRLLSATPRSAERRCCCWTRVCAAKARSWRGAARRSTCRRIRCSHGTTPRVCCFVTRWNEFDRGVS